MSDTVRFESVHGKKVFTVFSEPENGLMKIVIMNHGFKGSTLGSSRSYVNFARLLVKNGISVLRFDQPCSGNSEGNFINSSFNEWVNTIIHFSQKYLSQGYQVALLGHSMGADASLVAATRLELVNKIPIIFLWAPDSKSNPKYWFMKDSKLIDENSQIYEESGQQFHASYWQEVYDADFFKRLNQYHGKIHLVYGENDKFVSEELRNRVISAVTNKKQEVMILKGQDHMMWDYGTCIEVFNTELQILKNEFFL